MIGIVGGGLSGLALGLALRERGVDVVVLEGDERAGGVIRSSQVEGRVLDHGPQRARLSPEVKALVTQLGLTERILEAPPELPLYVFRKGRLRAVPFNVPEFLRSDLLSLRGRARVLLEPVTGGVDDDETVGAFFRRKLGDEAYLALAGPLFGGLYGSDPDEMYTRHALAELLAGLGVRRSLLVRYLQGALSRAGRIPAVTFVGGMEELPRAMADALGSTLHLDTPVDDLAPRGAGWTIRSGEREWDVERVVMTTPAGITARLLEGVAPGVAERIHRLDYNRLALVHLVSECNLHGWGFQVALEEELRTRGVTWNASIFGRDGIYTAFLGDPGPDLGHDAEIARKEFREITGCEARVLSVDTAEIPAWNRSWAAVDEPWDLPAGLHLFANWESRVGIPARIRKAGALARTLSAEGSSPSSHDLTSSSPGATRR